jgi:hypothetical protein
MATPPEISGQDLRSAVGRTLGWQYLQSAAFQLKRSGNAFRFSGHGYGHGVGLRDRLGGLRSTARRPGKFSSAISRARRLARLDRDSRLRLPTEIVRRSHLATASCRNHTAPKREALPLPGTAADVVISMPEGDEGEQR